MEWLILVLFDESAAGTSSRHKQNPPPSWKNHHDSAQNALAMGLDSTQ